MSTSVKLGIVGGCLGSTRSIPLSDLYHRRLVRRFEARGAGRLSIALGGYNDPGELIDQVKRMVDRKRVDVLVVQLRPHPLARSAWLLWWRSDGGGRGRLAPHPALWDRAKNTYDPAAFSYEATHASWRETPGSPPPTQRAPAVWRRWLKKGNINTLLGWLAGLHHWALHQHVGLIRAARDICAGAGVRLIVIGPLSMPILPAADRLCRSVSRALAVTMAAEDIDYVETWGARDARGCDILMPDAQHMNALGHAHLADLLEPSLAAALVGIKPRGGADASQPGDHTPA